jgi:LysR family transcriptional activator of nhaA
LTWLNYHHLYYFHIIAREGSIARASRILRIGQSALSIQLKQLEESFETKLFDRNAKKLTLSKMGQVVFNYSTAIFKLGDEMVEAVKEGRTTPLVKVDIGVLDSVPKSVTHQLVVAALGIQRCYVSITEAGGEELLQDLKLHKLHLVLTNSHAPITKHSDLFSRSVGEFPVVICGAPKFQRLVKTFPKSLDGQPFILPTSHSKLRNDIEHFFAMNDIGPVILGESQDSELDKRLALSGHALIAISRFGVKSELNAKKLICIGNLKSVKEQVWLTGVRRHIANPVASRLLDTFVLQ